MEFRKTLDIQREIWDLRAKTFPRYSPEPGNYESRMLKLAQGIGADFSDKTVLDVGCGAGMYTLRLAKMAGFVTALDISEEMLSINEKDAKREKITNIEYLHQDWLDFNPKRKYDLIFCAMTPALQTLEGKLKVLTFRGAQVVYFGYSKPMNNHVLNAFSEIYDLKLKPFKSAPDQRLFLETQGVIYKTGQLSGSWDKVLSKEDFLVNLAAVVAFQGGSLNNLELDGFLEKFSDGQGKYREIVDYQTEVIVWTNF
ncbi:MAG: class I SAM-dependent methyltransferase [Deltaproteobacteria bacterium]|jgi:SAM-dependent methyltransferase|nr:class I SAM-dependent methyltransferase [Deltaproteobacteria bacterium]